MLQIDEPFLAGYPEEVELAVKAINMVFEGVEGPTRALHVCYGNRYARPALGRPLRVPVPGRSSTRRSTSWCWSSRARATTTWTCSRSTRRQSLTLGLGVIDVKNSGRRAAELIASRVRQALQVLPPDRLMINPDCGLRHLPADIARAKLRAMSEGAALVRAEVPRRDIDRLRSVNH